MRPPWFIAALSAVAGCVDTFGYLTLGHIFTSNLTGNTGVMTIAAVGHNADEAMRRGIVIVLFFGGAIVGAGLVDDATQPHQLRRGLFVEAILLLAVVALAWGGAGVDPRSAGWFATAALLSVAMGLQNAALAHPFGEATHTTHLTGPVTDLGTDLVRWLRAPAGAKEPSTRRMRRIAGRIVGFAGGGLAGAVLFASAHGLTPIVPAAALVALAMRR
jgi:uncharacterized membrane protein YoaK (UPF0700 family)